MEYFVTGCINCPMFKSENDERYGWLTDCGHPSFEGKGVVEEIYIDGAGNPITPEKCPLNKEPITITKTV